MKIFSHISALSLTAIAALALLMPSCSSDEPAALQEIAVSGHYKGQSRAGSDTEDLPADYHMWVSGLYLNKGAGFFYLKNNLFEYNAADQTWYGSDHPYYPLEGKMDFVAFAGKSLGRTPAFGSVPYLLGNFTNENDQFTITALNLDYTSCPLDGYDDILASQVVEDVPCSHADDRRVELNFRHLMSNVRFTFRAETTDASNLFRVSRIVIKRVRLSGSVALRRDGKGRPWKTVEWNNLSDPVDIVDSTLMIQPIKVVTGEEELPYIDFFFPEQPVTTAAEPTDPNYSKIVPSFSIYFKYLIGDSDQTEEMNYIIDRNFMMPEKWEVGKRYFYNVECRIMPHIEFRVDCVVTDEQGFVIDKWVDEIPIPIDPMPNLPTP